MTELRFRNILTYQIIDIRLKCKGHIVIVADNWLVLGIEESFSSNHFSKDYICKM